MSRLSSVQNGAAVRRYRFLGVRLRVSSERPSALQLLDRLYGRFLDAGEATPDLDAHIAEDEQGARLELQGDRHRLGPEPVTDFHAYSILFTELLERLGGHFFVHAAALADPARTLLLAGPSGHGKTTMGVALTGRGFRLLSDDFAPLGREDRLVHPFPKRVGLRREPGADGPALPEGIEVRGEWLPFGDKWLADPEMLPGGCETRPRRPTHLLLLEDAAQGEGARSFRLALVSAQAEFERELGGLAGVRVQATRTPGGQPALHVSVPGEAGALAAFHEACSRFRHRMLLFEPDRPPVRFDGEAEIRPLDRLAAALGLMRHVLNRSRGSSLLSSAGGSVGRLVAELASLLQGVRCARLRVGRLPHTVRRVIEWTEESP